MTTYRWTVKCQDVRSPKSDFLVTVESETLDGAKAKAVDVCEMAVRASSSGCTGLEFSLEDVEEVRNERGGGDDGELDGPGDGGDRPHPGEAPRDEPWRRHARSHEWREPPELAAPRAVPSAGGGGGGHDRVAETEATHRRARLRRRVVLVTLASAGVVVTTLISPWSPPASLMATALIVVAYTYLCVGE